MPKFFLLCIVLGLVSCGGGAQDTPIVQQPQSTISTSSYINAKQNNIYTLNFAEDRGQPINADAQVFFTDSQGSSNLFLASLQYSPAQIKELALPSKYQFYRLEQNRWQAYQPKIDQLADNCLHPRKAVTADFNGDGIIDIVLACHGYDAGNFSGESSRILLSKGPNHYEHRKLEDHMAFYHGASAADLNKDGASDLIMAVGHEGIRVLINDGKGNFTVNKDLVKGTATSIYSVELIDINQDNQIDLMIGGHEWMSATRIVYGSAQGQFDLAGAKIIAPLAQAGVVLDFIHHANTIFILRTGGSDDRDPNFYKGLYLQQYTPSTGVSVTLLSVPNWQDPRLGSTRTWLTWIRIYQGAIVSLWGQAIRVLIN